MSKLDALFAYQETELQKEQLENAIRSTPSRMQLNRLHKALKTQQTTINQLMEGLETRAAQAKRLTDRAEQLENQLELEHGELETMRQDEESTAEEMTELRGDIERLNREIAAASREAKALITELETAVDEYRKTGQQYNKNKKEYDQLRAVCEKERDDSMADIAAFDKKLAEIGKTLDPQLMARYRRAKQHHTVPIVKVDAGKCSGCNMSLPMVVLKRLTAPDAVIECENCGRILYAEIG